MCIGYSVVTSQGDEVKQWSSPAELRELLGDIVSENDAQLLVAVSGYQLVCAGLEEASVHAFERMSRDLTAHGAPAALIARAHEAARDERRHASLVSELARARGGRVEAAQVMRTLEQMACENLVEGCVRETYGALLGAHQAAHARDVQLRAAMVEIANDELRHAALSHAVHAWLSTQLDSDARARLMEARAEAIAALQAQCASAEELARGRGAAGACARGRATGGAAGRLVGWCQRVLGLTRLACRVWSRSSGSWEVEG